MNGQRITIPMLPPKECNPNWRGHWTQRQAAVKSFRNAAKFCCMADSKFSEPNYEKAKVSIILTVPDMRYIRDTDNMLASLKPAIDGCVDAGVIVGDDPEHLEYNLPIKYVVSKSIQSGLVLEFEEVK